MPLMSFSAIFAFIRQFFIFRHYFSLLLLAMLLPADVSLPYCFARPFDTIDAFAAALLRRYYFAIIADVAAAIYAFSF